MFLILGFLMLRVNISARRPGSIHTDEWCFDGVRHFSEKESGQVRVMMSLMQSGRRCVDVPFLSALDFS
jgi:hypothetical protein